MIVGIDSDKIKVPVGLEYTGKRSLSEENIWTIIQNIQKAESWVMMVDFDGVFRFIPDI